ncbi:hypothetical protein SAMN05445756_0478 [Kytococcus aerolatus]|uniref:AEC family transporter n=1 Tax=Kytococcus aerolatus TaxID=592308 RepID=A0A212T5V3_9MICO|nr:AEC family transporter [Kytococcus aerolatus]SNC61418.1 hypothetical protein SAMN05445756_0478 [Kytococcus aerolatus]
MLDVIEGFWTIGVVIGVGYLAAARELVPDGTVEALSRVTFTLGTPALLFTIIAAAPLHQVLSPPLVITVTAALLVAGVFWLLGRAWGLTPGEQLIGAMASGYVNAANLGIPIAVYVLGDAVYASAVLLGQLLLVQPMALLGLDLLDADGTASRWRTMTRPLRNPMTVGSLLGLLFSVQGWSIPGEWGAPLEMIGDLSVPAMLLAFGMSLRWGPRPLRGGAGREVVAAVLLKMAAMPLVGLGLGLLWGLDAQLLLVVAVTCALPSAQNVFVLATVYRQAPELGRDVVLTTTLLSLPVTMLLVLLLR